jgi:hypothetical protein
MDGYRGNGIRLKLGVCRHLSIYVKQLLRSPYMTMSLQQHMPVSVMIGRVKFRHVDV